MSTVIALYTGTGNSLYAAKRIAEKTGEDTVIRFTEDFLSGAYELPVGTDRLGIIFPVYFGGVPCPVRRFIREYLASHDNSGLGYVFVIATHGGSPIYALADADRELQDAGIALSYASSVRMPDGYLPLMKKAISPEKAEAMREKADVKLAVAADDIAGERIHLPQRGPGWRIIRSISAKMKPGENSKLKLSQSCTGCGVCASICPEGNITMENGRPVMGSSCVSCFACYHRCPVNAIEYKGAAGQYKGFVDTGELRRR